MNNYEGSFICFEGIDGAGKSVVIEMLKNKYEENDDIVFTQEPSNEFYGQAVRQRLASEHDVTPADFFAFLADRYQHVENTVIPALKDGKTVISDRYALSTYAYQTKVLDEAFPHMAKPKQYIEEMTFPYTVEPEEYFYLKVSVNTALDRIEPEEKYEKRERLEEAKRMYDYLSEEKENVTTIHGEMHEEKLFNTVLTYLQKYE